jgi:type I restriction enzyme R subunit
LPHLALQLQFIVVMELMKSINFEFLRSNRPELADLGAFAEQYVFADPSSAVGKLRIFAETIVDGIYHTLGLSKPFRPQFVDLLTGDQFVSSIPTIVLNKLHFLRKEGNRATHGVPITGTSAMQALMEAYDIGRWIHLTFLRGRAEDCAKFQDPPKSAAVTSEDLEKLRQEKDALRRKLQDKEAAMSKLLEDLEKTRATQKAASEDEVHSFIEAGKGAVNELRYDEATTRKRLIDTALVEAGWDITDPKQVTLEVPVQEDTLPSGESFADYVLWDPNGLPLAVVEAKRTSKSEELGRKQAQLYAAGLEKEHGQRPVIFYTNGYRLKIWNDAMGEPPRNAYGYYSKDDLQYLIQQRSDAQKQLDNQPVNIDIINRDYQIEAVKRVCERFQNKHRKSLVVLATGTGKTRVAIALADLLRKAGWVRRILFLCDRRELRKQAKNAFNEFIPAAPVVLVNHQSSKTQEAQIYLATYPGMMKYFERYDVSYFDLIIADESHRSIYNRYRGLFQYFDALQVGLTATPVNRIHHDTYRLFGCDDQDPTAYYSYDEAITSTPPHLVPFEVREFTTEFLRQGMKYNEMSRDQQEELNDQEEVPELIDYDPGEVDRAVFNRDTNRQIIRNLMEKGVKDASGSFPGKTIIFARNHNHAVLLRRVFEEMYPQYGGNFCTVIDNQEPRAEQLIDDFKGEGKSNDVQIAISVDMLDTGVDIPQVVNLVMAKPVRSYVKFWQMIGRGTRLCKDLFGPGQDKEKFVIFDHWGNFRFFDEQYREVQDSKKKSLLQLLFEQRIILAKTAVDKSEGTIFDISIKLCLQDIKDLPEKSIQVRDHWREVKTAEQEELLKRFDAATIGLLRNEIAPLMMWRNVRGKLPAYRFDYLICQLQVEFLKESVRFQDLKGEVIALAAELPITIQAVRDKENLIRSIRRGEFWDSADVLKFEEVRRELRSLMQYTKPRTGDQIPPKEIDVKEDLSLIESHEYTPRVSALEERAYRKRVEEVLKELFEKNPILQKIKSGKKVTEQDLDALCSLVLTQYPDVDLNSLTEFYPEAKDLQFAIRSIIGLDAAFVDQCFSNFTSKHSTLTAKQIQFMRLLKNHIGKYGAIAIDRLYEDPFIQLDSAGIDGIFQNENQITDLLVILETFQPKSGINKVET